MAPQRLPVIDNHNHNAIYFQVQGLVRPSDSVRISGNSQHSALPDDEAGRTEEGQVAQLQDQGRQGRVQGVQEAQGLQLHHAHAHRRHHGE